MSIGIILFICLMVLLLGGLPIATCIGGATVITMIVSGLPLMNFASKVYASVNSFTLMAIPFFMLAGSLMATGGMSRRLVRLASSLVGWVTGGLTHVMILASAFFAALSGSARLPGAAIGGMMIPEMKKKGFPGPKSAAVQAVAGTIGPIIPPSIPMRHFCQYLCRRHVCRRHPSGYHLCHLWSVLLLSARRKALARRAKPNLTAMRFGMPLRMLFGHSWFL